MVIAIIGTLVGLLLPSVQASREAARRTKCTNQLKQLALAVHSYEASQTQLPHNQYGDYDFPQKFGGYSETSQSWSWLVHVFPYLEEEALFKRGGVPRKSLAASGILATTLPGLLCPSDEIESPMQVNSHYLHNQLVGMNSYKGVSGANFCFGDWANNGVFGSDCEYWNNGDGMFYSMDWKLRKPMSMVRDGLSHTMMIGESVWNKTRASCDNPCYGLGYSWAHAVETTATAAIPPNGTHPDGTPYAEDDWQGHNGFSSRHPTGVLFAFADGSVQFINESISLAIYRALATVAGNEQIPPEY